MADDLALAVGKIILAWGRLDQRLHLLIRSAENALNEPRSIEGRFTERRKIFRRLCMRLSQGDDNYKRRFDRACAQLVRLERKRGTIAHGYAGEVQDGAYFLNVPDSFDQRKDLAERAMESYFTYPALAALENEIDQAAAELLVLSAEAFGLWKQGNPQAPAQ